MTQEENGKRQAMKKKGDEEKDGLIREEEIGEKNREEGCQRER